MVNGITKAFPYPLEVTGVSYLGLMNYDGQVIISFRPLSRWLGVLTQLHLMITLKSTRFRTLPRWLGFLIIVDPENEYTNIAFPPPLKVTEGSYWCSWPYDV